MRGGSIQYTPEYLRGEIIRLTQLLQQGISAEQRVYYQKELATVRQYLANSEKTVAGS